MAFLCVAVSEVMNLASVTSCTIRNALPVPVALPIASYFFTDFSTSVAIFVPCTPAWTSKTGLVAYGPVNEPATLNCSIVFASSH